MGFLSSLTSRPICPLSGQFVQHYFVDRKMEHFPQCLLLSRLNHFIAIYTERASCRSILSRR